MSRYTTKRSASPTKIIKLPYKAKSLHKDNLKTFRHVFALYLRIQKQIDIEDLDEHELRGRWKSFYKKWNQADLAEGWYDPETKAKADQNAQATEEEDEDGDEEREFGPAIPRNTGVAPGPAYPTSQDLSYRNEMRSEAAAENRKHDYQDRKAHQNLQKDRLEELAPKADAGTHERKREKKQEISAYHASSRQEKSPGADDVKDSDLMGDDGIDSYKRKRKEEAMRKSERQLRREDFERARAEERKDKMRARSEKESKTMEMLKELAKQRFGDS